MARLANLQKSAVGKRIQRGYKGVDKSKLYHAQVRTPGGVQGVEMLTELLSTTISSRVNRGYKGVRKEDLKTAEVLTGGGIQGVCLLTEDIMLDWLIDDNPTRYKKL